MHQLAVPVASRSLCFSIPYCLAVERHPLEHPPNVWSQLQQALKQAAAAAAQHAG